MHLGSLYIDGYGPFQDALLGELAKGFNLVIAEDPASAKAINEFIWAVLFGFDRERDARASGGFLGFESATGPVTVARYLRGRNGASDSERGLVTVTGASQSLGEIVGMADPDYFRRLLHIDTSEIAAFHELICYQIAETAAKQARAVAEVEAAARQAAGIPDKPPTLDEIMDEMRTKRALQLARVENLDLSVRGVGRKLRGTRQREARLRMLVALRPAWNTMLELQRQMDALPRLPYLSDDPFRDLEKAGQSRSFIATRVEAARAAEDDRRMELESLSLTEEEAAIQGELEALLAWRAQHGESVRTMSEVAADLHTEEANLKLELAGIKGDWTAERAQSFAGSVTDEDLRQHEDVLRRSTKDFEAANQAKNSASLAEAEAQAAALTARRRLDRLSDVADADPRDLEKRATILRDLKSAVRSVASKKAELSRLQVRRTEAKRLGSGVNRMLIMAQLGVSAAFAFIGLFTWVAARIDTDPAVARTGLIMASAGGVGILFSLGFLALQRRPRMRVTLQEITEKAAEERQAAQSAAAEPAAAPGPRRSPSAWSLTVRIARILWFILRKTYSGARITLAWARTAYARSKAEKAAAAQAQPREEADTTESAPLARRGSFLSRFIRIERPAPDEPAGAAEPEAAEEEEPEAGPPPAGKRSPFGIMELLGRFIQLKRADSEPIEEVDPEDAEAGALLIAIADEIKAEDEAPLETPDGADEIDEEAVAAVVQEVSADVPEELREAQKHAELPKRGLLDRLAGILRIEVRRPPATEAELAAELAEEPVDEEEAVAFAEPATDDSEEAEDAPAPAEAVEDAGEPDAAEGQPVAEAEPPAQEGDEAPRDDEAVPAEAEVQSRAAEDTATPPGDGEEIPAGETAEADGQPMDGEEQTPRDGVEQEPADGEVSFEIGDPLGALDRAVAATSLEIEQLESELERLLTVYAATVGRPKAQFPPLTVELVDNELVRTERDIARHEEAREHREKLSALESSLEEARRSASAASQELARAKTAAEAARGVWVDWLGRMDLPADLTADDVRRLMRAIDPIRSRLERIESLRDRLAELTSETEALDRRVRAAAGDSVPASAPIDSAFGDVERLAMRGRSRKDKIASLAREIRLLESSRREAEAELNQAEARVQRFLDEAGAEDESHFRELIAQAARRRGLKAELDRMRVDTPLLTGPDSAAVEKDLRTLSHERVEAELAEIPDRIQRLRAQLSELQHDLSSAEIELAGMPEIPEPAEGGKRDPATGGYVMPGVLSGPLDSAAITSAVRYLQTLTDDRYSGISPVLSEDRTRAVGYKVCSEGGEMRDPDEEDSASLFVALRMALIEQHAGRAASLPVVIPDFSGDAPAAASRAVIVSLAALAERRQVICITADPAAPARFAILGNASSINLVDATTLESPFQSVVGG